MNKDSDKNENRRDGEKSRSFGRRDDARPGKPAGNRPFPSRSNDDRPRFGRTDGPRPADGADRGAANRGAADRPRRDTQPGDRPQNSRNERPGGSPFGSRGRSDADRRPTGPARPSFGRDRNEPDRTRPTDSRPRFERDDKPRTDQPRSGDSDQRRSRSDSDRNTDRPTDSGASLRPRFERSDRASGPDQPDRPRVERRDDKPRFERSNDRPRFGGTDAPRSDRSAGAGGVADRPRTDSGASLRPRFERRDDKGNSRPGEPRARNDGPRFSRDSNDRSRPGSGRATPGRATPGRSGKPTARRVGGFSREADERNRENWSEGRTPAPGKRSDAPENPASGSRNTRFTPEQRKDSGERRTGFFVKAPNYELEQKRQRMTGGTDAPRTARPRTDKYEGKPKTSRPDNSDRDEKPARTPGEPGTTRLNRYIANSGVCSRREADELIAQGDITVNGQTVTEMGFRVKEGDMVKYGTKALTPERFVYVLLNKPKDYLTTTEDPDERKTVMELVADAGNFRMYPVGRLDRKTTGLLLMTNDGELADKLTHPSNDVRKIYQVELDKPITEEHFSALKKGVELEDGPIKPDALSIVTPDAYVVGIEIHSGRNRIVRRMFESLGYDVTKLDRTAYAGLTKKELPRGKWRFLDPKEVVKLKYLS